MKMIKKFLISILILLFASTCWGGVHFSDDAVDEIAVTAHATLDNGNASYSCWAKSDIVVYGDATHILNKQNTNPGNVSIVVDGTSNKIRFTYRLDGDEGTILVTEADAVLDTSWHHYVGTYDGDNGYLYVDGVQQTTTDGTDGSIDTDNSGELAIANHPTVDKKFDGSITEIAIWKVALNQTQIDLLAKSKVKGIPYQISPSNLVLYLPLDDIPFGADIDGRTFIDRSVNTNNGTGLDADNDSISEGEEILSYP